MSISYSLPALVSHSPTKKILAALQKPHDRKLETRDLLGAVILHGDRESTALLGGCLLAPFAPHHLYSAALRQSIQLGDLTDSIPDQDCFDANVWEMLEELEACVQTRQPEQNLLCLLLALIFRGLNDADRREYPMLDIQRGLDFFRVIAETPGECGKSREESPVAVPIGLAPVDDLTRLARQLPPDEHSPYDGDTNYSALIQEIIRKLHGTQPRHLLLTGERGVGLVTLVSELARRIVTQPVTFLESNTLLRIDCRFFPEEESRQRLSALLSHLANDPSLIACLDGFASLLRGPLGTNNVRVLLAMLPRLEGRLIGLCTPRDYEELIAGDADMLEVFSRIHVPEPDLSTACNLVRHYAVGLGKAYGVDIQESAIQSATALTANYILHERLPGKAVRVLNQICQDLDYEHSQLGNVRQAITEDQVVETVANMSGVPVQTLCGIADEVDYEASLGELVVGQDHVVKEVASELALIKAGLTDANKPASVMLFIGQTGTGKTEMAKALARFYSASKRLRIYTLGNFIESHSVSGIIGVPAGYVGHDQGGRLVNDLNSDPYCVVLLDEADKAHPDVLQPFLNLFDEGWVRDQRGVQAFADKAIFILTANVGQRMITDMAKQGKSVEEMTARMKEALSQIRHTKSNRPVFSPEFLARIKRTVLFKPLDQQAMYGISRKIAREMQVVWQEKRHRQLELTDAVLNHIAEEAQRVNERSESREGGRIVRKLMADMVEKRIQREVTKRPREYRACQRVLVELKASAEMELESCPEITVHFEPADQPPDQSSIPGPPKAATVAS